MRQHPGALGNGGQSPISHLLLRGPVALLSLALLLALAACTGAADSNSKPDAQQNTFSGETAGPETEGKSSDSKDGTSQMDLAWDQTYQWVGAVVVSGVRGLELLRDCDRWSLQGASPEVEQRLMDLAGKKAIVWGTAGSPETILATAAYGPDDPMIMMYVPEYPCPGDVPTSPPPYYEPGPYYEPAPYLQPGEIAAMGTLLWENGNAYLDTPSGKIYLLIGERLPLLRDDGATSVGETSPASQVYPDGTEVMATGHWRIQDGALVIQVREIIPFAPKVEPEPYPYPIPEPVDGYGTLYGKVSIGPLCPVEPCPGDTPDPYSSRSLVLQPAGGGDPLYVELQNDGYFKAQVPSGAYVVDLTDCVYMGCQHALPQKVLVEPGVAVELQILVDTGIR